MAPTPGLRKSDDGIWSVTLGPLNPEMYVYFFTVDGIRLTDPSNPQVKIGYVTTTTTELLTVPGNQPAFYDVQDVPHGEIRTQQLAMFFFVSVLVRYILRKPDQCTHPRQVLIEICGAE